jgi:hypothetical protein
MQQTEADPYGMTTRTRKTKAKSESKGKGKIKSDDNGLVAG